MYCASEYWSQYRSKWCYSFSCATGSQMPQRGRLVYHVSNPSQPGPVVQYRCPTEFDARRFNGEKGGDERYVAPFTEALSW
jgi:hypothetical protein